MRFILAIPFLLIGLAFSIIGGLFNIALFIIKAPFVAMGLLPNEEQRLLAIQKTRRLTDDEINRLYKIQYPHD